MCKNDIKKECALRILRARAVCEAYTSSPRGAHPCGAFCFMGNSAEFPMKRKKASDHSDALAALPGLEPGNDGVRVRCR